MDLIEALNAFTQHASEARRLSPLTTKAYSGDILGFAAWRQDRGLSLQIAHIQGAEVETWMADSSQVSPATIRRRLDALSSLFRFLLKRGLAAVNPIDEVDRPRCPDSHRAYMTEEQMAQLLDVVQGTQERTILLLLCCLGLRRSEVVTLDRGHVDLQAGTVEIKRSKGDHSRTLPIPAELRPVLEEHLTQRDGHAGEPLFLSYHQNRLSRSALARLFTKWLREANLEGLGLSLHSGRHGCASRWLRSGLSIIEVQQLLGHRSVDTTGRYCHVALHETAASIEAKVAPIGQPPVAEDRRPESADWARLLADLSAQQRDALLALARAMAAPRTG